METIKVKYVVLVKALDSFDEAVSFFKTVKSMHGKEFDTIDYEVVYRAARDSLIQRFEFSIELFWKYLRIFLEEEKHAALISNTPGDVIRSASNARILSEEIAERCIEMIKSRNLTSHIYREEIAEQLARVIPEYYILIKSLAQSLSPE